MKLTFGSPKRIEGARPDAAQELPNAEQIAQRAQEHLLGRHIELKTERRARSESFLSRHWRR